MKYFSKIAILFSVVVLLFNGGCKKLPTDTSLLVLNISPYFGSDSLVLGKSYSLVGDSISFSRATFYISNMVLYATDGTPVSVPGFILATPSTGSNIIAGSIPIGTYKSLSFSVGVVADSNHLDPATHPTGPLAAQTPTMHFATSADGYIFMAVEGSVDSANNHLSPNKTFSYHLGLDSLLRTVNMPDHSVAPYAAFNATGTKVLTINLIADFSLFLQHVNVAQQTVTNSTDNVPLASTLASRVPGMFRYQN